MVRESLNRCTIFANLTHCVPPSSEAEGYKNQPRLQCADFDSVLDSECDRRRESSRPREASSGLTEKMVMKHLRWRKYAAFSAACAAKEICCICEEDYGEGDNVGMLSCGDGFHFVCVGRWLRQRNACLICRKTALLSIV
ncbi:unnamed protein product [Spirodela intermedia]|uniref:RING-type E3 ubiquitin transferase n=1 Tax=Spirodela intermedia TaxID=51605 RepID=A0A7I8LIF0_SPIIN|nr:unnamed protein product [Spirodela intermedia]